MADQQVNSMTTAFPIVDANTLVAFDNVAAGHEGVMTDPSGDLVIKPCTQAELAFYEQTVAYHPDFAALMPTFLGSLELGETTQLRDTVDAAQATAGQPAIVLPASEKDARVSAARGATPPPLRGKKLNTELAIVLENVVAGFKRPNIMDVKLGKRLWADDAQPAKRRKLDDVAAQTTSASLGFRVAGMKVWTPEGYRIYDKWYGRARTADNAKEAFADLLCLSARKTVDGSSRDILDGIVHAAEEIERSVRSQETRMYSSSLLLVYEGDPEARREALEAEIARPKRRDTLGEAEADSDGEDDEQEPDKKIFDIRLIDFAHAEWTPGQGPDENMLSGISSVCKILRGLVSAAG